MSMKRKVRGDSSQGVHVHISDIDIRYIPVFIQRNAITIRFRLKLICGWLSEGSFYIYLLGLFLCWNLTPGKTSHHTARPAGQQGTGTFISLHSLKLVEPSLAKWRKEDNILNFWICPKSQLFYGNKSSFLIITFYIL